jgi:16S rRNA (cytidine1402-2'-O)-methyltransferase
MSSQQMGCLWVVATPIGHRDDISLRAIETLRSVALIAAEDTRHSRPLLLAHNIATPLVALHEHNEREAVAALVHRLVQGESIALISDAGTPLISDPGFRLVRAAREAGIRCMPVPGACGGGPAQRPLRVRRLPAAQVRRAPQPAGRTCWRSAHADLL